MELEFVLICLAFSIVCSFQLLKYFFPMVKITLLFFNEPTAFKIQSQYNLSINKNDPKTA